MKRLRRRGIVRTSIAEQADAQSSWRPGLVFGLLVSYFALFGITFGSQGVIWADLVARLQLSKGVFGTAQLSAPLVSIGILLMAGPLCTRFSKKRLILLGLVSLSLAIAWMSLASDLWGLVGALLLSGAGFGLIETAANSATLDWEDATGRKVMNLMHAGFSAGAVLGSIAASAMLGAGLGYTLILQLVALVGALILLATLPARFAPVEAAAEGSGDPMAALRLLFSGPVVMALAVICMISTLGESVANTWSVIYLSDMGAPAWIGGAAFALFNGTMFLGRLGNATLVARLGERASLLVSAVCMMVAGVILVALPLVVPVVVAFALLGVAVAGIVPTVLSATARLAPGSSGAVTGAIMSVAYVSFIICPPLIGWVAEASSLRVALVVVLITGLLQLVLARTIPATQR
jgi:fucose permease